MAYKLFFALLAICLLQGLQAKSLNDRRDVIDDIINKAVKDARDAIQALNEKAHEAIESSKLALEDTAQKFIAAAEDLLQKAATLLEGLAKKITAQIEEMIKQAAASGKDIAKCVNGKVEQAEKIEEDAVTNMKKCLDKAKDIEATVKTTFEKIVTELESELDNVEVNVLACLPNSTHHSLEEAKEIAKCFAKEISHLPEEQQAVINKLSSELMAAALQTESALQEEATCIATEQKAADDKEHALIKDIEKCISNLP